MSEIKWELIVVNWDDLSKVKQEIDNGSLLNATLVYEKIIKALRRKNEKPTGSNYDGRSVGIGG